MQTRGHVTTKIVETADIFIQEIVPLGRQFGHVYFPTSWYYRGHADAQWPLVSASTYNRPQTILVLGEWSVAEEAETEMGILELCRLNRELCCRGGNRWDVALSFAGSLPQAE